MSNAQVRMNDPEEVSECPWAGLILVELALVS